MVAVYLENYWVVCLEAATGNWSGSSRSARCPPGREHGYGIAPVQKAFRPR